jgi:hypothetical protein
MGHQIVYALLGAWLKELRRRPYRDLVFRMGDTQTKGVTGEDGK